MSTTTTLSVTTDLLDYAPGSTAYITATDVSLGGAVEFEVLHVIDPGLDGIWGTLDDTLGDNSGGGHEEWIVTDGGVGDLDGIVNGIIQTSWYVDPDDSLGATFLLAATDSGSDGTFGTEDDQTATSSFTHAVQTDYRGWENITSAGVDWANGGINAGQGLYLEGDVIPHAVSLPR